MDVFSGPTCTRMRAPLLFAGARHAINVLGTVTVSRRRWLCIGLWGETSFSERRVGGEGWKGLELRGLRRRRRPIDAIALGLRRRRERGALLIEVRRE